jgi:basic amino acid/polyamine antiporter, APA family
LITITWVPEADTHSPHLQRQLGLWDSASLVVGTIIGAGIFLVPSIMARHLPSASGILVVWIVGGILSYFGALAYAELGAMFPATGGQYVFLREGCGRMVAFLCGWTLFLVVMPGNIAFLATGFATYLSPFLAIDPARNPLISRLIAIAFIGLISLINYRGVRLGALVQNAFTALKLLGIAALVVAAFASRAPNQLHLSFSSADFPPKQFGLALAAALIAFEGWNNLSFVNGEILNARRNVPIALGMGVLVSAGIYVLLTAAYLRVLPVAAVAASPRVGGEVADRVFGAGGAVILSITILISIIGSANGTALTAARLYFAQAADGLFFARFATVHPKFKTPSFSIVMQGVWASILALTGSYELVATYAIFCAWFFYLLVVVGLMILRWRAPAVPRPYRMLGYPFTPIAFAAVTVWFLINSIAGNPVPSLTGMAILLAGIPVYLIWGRRALVPAIAVLQL